MVETARAKLITIFASAELQDRLEDDLRSLGARGYSVTRVDGRGQKGPRVRGIFEIGNVRVETIVAPSAAEAILAHLAQQAETKDIVAFSQDVDAVPRKQFV